MSSRRSFVASKALANLMKNSVSDFPGPKKKHKTTRHSDVMPKISLKKKQTLHVPFCGWWIRLRSNLSNIDLNVHAVLKRFVYRFWDFIKFCTFWCFWQRLINLSPLPKATKNSPPQLTNFKFSLVIFCCENCATCFEACQLRHNFLLTMFFFHEHFRHFLTSFFFHWKFSRASEEKQKHSKHH